jgi:hypothetical protein
MKINALLYSKWLKIVFLFLLFFAAVIFALRSCKPLPTTYSFNGTTIFFPMRKPPGLFGSRAVPAGELMGQLKLVDGCLRIESDTSYAPVWPPGYTLTFENGVVEILDVRSRGVVYVGDEIYVDGGETSVKGVAAIAEMMQEEILDRCEGPYWFVGNVVRRVR